MFKHDARNGKKLVEKFICWDICPDVGMVFLMYQGVDSVEACADSVKGAPLISPEPIRENSGVAGPSSIG